MTHHLEGRVFTRLKEYEALPLGFREEVTALRRHLTKIQSRVFVKHHPNLIKSVVGVKYKALLRHIREFLGSRKLSAVSEQESTGNTSIATTKMTRAKPFAVALILSGFITPYKEDPPNLTEHFTFKSSDLFVPVGPTVVTIAGSDISVWDVSEGALFAGTVKRKAGFLAAVTEGKDVYVVVNGLRKTLTLFESDVSREPILQVNAVSDGANVALDKSHFDLGVKIWNQTGTELFNLSTVQEREEFVQALVTIGMKCQGDGLAGLNETKDKSESQEVQDASPTKPENEQTETQEDDSQTTTSAHDDGDSGENQPLNGDKLPRPHSINLANSNVKSASGNDVFPGPHVGFAEDNERQRARSPPLGGYYDEPRQRSQHEIQRARYYDGPGPRGDVYRRSSTLNQVPASDEYGQAPVYDERDYNSERRHRACTQPLAWEHEHRPHQNYDEREPIAYPHQQVPGYYTSPDDHTSRPPAGYSNPSGDRRASVYYPGPLEPPRHYGARPRADTLPPLSKYHDPYEGYPYPPGRSFDEPRRRGVEYPYPDDYPRRLPARYDEDRFVGRHYEEPRRFYPRYVDDRDRIYDPPERPSRYHRPPDHREYRSYSPHSGGRWNQDPVHGETDKSEVTNKEDHQRRASQAPYEVAP